MEPRRPRTPPMSETLRKALIEIAKVSGWIALVADYLVRHIP